MPRMEFGYSAPPGDRGLEPIRPREFMGDLQRSLDFAAQHFPTLWVSDHFNYKRRVPDGVLDAAELDCREVPGP